MVSANEIGKFKKEYDVVRGIFLAPKSYRLEVLPNDEVLTNPDVIKF